MFIKHHGIEGQKWGVRNGPPYPLNKTVSARIKAKGYQKKRANIHKYRSKLVGTPHHGVWNELDRRRLEWVQGDITGNVAALIDNGFNKWNIDAEHGWDEVYTRKGMSTEKAERFNVNPSFGTPGTMNNCSKCTAALAMIAKGYNVHAGRSDNGCLATSMDYWFDGAVTDKRYSIDDISDRIDDYGRGSYGEMVIRRPDGSGHSAFFFNDKESNTVHIKDGQTNMIYDSVEKFLNDEGADPSRGVHLTRLDTATPNYDHLTEDSVLRYQYKNPDLNQIIVLDDWKDKSDDDNSYTGKKYKLW